MIAATLSATPTLNKFEPSALPIANSGCPSTADTADEKISGAEVPNATIVRPIIRGEAPKFLARPEAPKTNLSAPQIKPMNPRTIMAESRNIGQEYSGFRRSAQLDCALRWFASNNLLKLSNHVNSVSEVWVKSRLRSRTLILSSY